MLQPDAQITAALALLMEQFVASSAMTLPDRGDALGLRAVIDAGMAVAPAPESEGVSMTLQRIPTSDGDHIEMLWYRPPGWSRSSLGPAVIYLHGGGMIAGAPAHMDGIVRHYVHRTGVCFGVPAYRLAPEHPGERLARDGFDALLWLIAQSKELAIDPQRIAVMGESGGGGVAAGVAILARDSGVDLAKQILIYPMLDDRNTVPDPSFPAEVGWDWDSNWTCWRAVLGGDVGRDGVSSVASPARLDRTLKVLRLDISRSARSIFSEMKQSITPDDSTKVGCRASSTYFQE